VARIASSRSRLFVAAIDKRTGEAFMIDVKRAGVPILRALKASAAIPIFYNRTVDVGGRPCMDGGLVIPIGIKQAVASGCTHVLVLSTRSSDYVSSPPNWVSRFMFNLICARGSAGVNRAFAERHLRSRESRDLSLGRAPLPDGVSIATVCADPEETVSRMTTDRKKLHTGAVSYGRKVLRLFGRDAESWTLPEDCAGAGVAPAL
jgi:predicted acylesterase/phospholipase RssA